ncbi:MAG: LysR substrate-binding domain-containing protein [Geminicoccaceae bacterium]
MLREARTMLAALARIEALAEGSGEIAGTLFLGVIPTASTLLLPQALKSLKNAHPHLGIRVESGLSGELSQKLAQGVLDAAIVTAPPSADPAFAEHLLIDEPLVLIDLPADDGPLVLDAVRRRPFIRFNRRAGVGEVIDRLLELLGLGTETAMELDSIDAITRMVALGLGVAIVPRSTLSPSMARRLRILPLDHPAARRRVVLLHEGESRKARLIAPLVAALQNS